MAARASVSRATASRVLRGGTNVSPEARAAVEAAAQELAYTANRAARSLVTGRSDSVAFFVDETEDRLFSDPYFLGVLRAAQATMSQADRQVVVTVASTSDDYRRFLNYAAGRHVDGVLLLSLHGKDELPDRLEKLGIPAVLSGRPLAKRSHLHYVDADNVEGARLATGHLLATGHRRVATITGPQDMCAGQDRLTGYRTALADHGVAIRESLVRPAMFSFSTGYQAMQQLLEAEPSIDAVFAASDLTASGAIRAIVESGRRVPDDVAVVGFDDLGDAEALSPPLTTIRQPVAEIGRTMAEKLLTRIDGGRTRRATVLPVELVRRKSA